MRQQDVQQYLQQRDPAGTIARRPGQSNTHSSEYIVPDPDWLWHDKFRNYGIEIYGIIDAHPRRILYLRWQQQPHAGQCGAPVPGSSSTAPHDLHRTVRRWPAAARVDNFRPMDDFP
jgi:hypothetical protein